MSRIARRRERCDRLAERYYPIHARREHRLRRVIAERLPEKGAFLDAGSGPYLGMARHFVEQARVSIAMDLLPFHTHMLATGARGVRGDLAALPFREGSIDVVSLRSVLEHLADPVRALADLARILKPGGWVIALAPSRWYFASVVGRLVPERVADRLLRAIFGTSVHDNFPVYYRANTPGAVAKATRAAGMELVESIVCPHPPGYLKFSPFLFRLGVVYDRLAGATRPTRILQASFLYLIRKPS